MTEIKNYLIEYVCPNCREVDTLIIERGVTLYEHINKNKPRCSNCGCVFPMGVL